MPSSPPPPTQIAQITQRCLPARLLRHTDVICGRGRYSKYPGNLTFLSLDPSSINESYACNKGVM